MTRKQRSQTGNAGRSGRNCPSGPVRFGAEFTVRQFTVRLLAYRLVACSWHLFRSAEVANSEP
jgi:hypothetical protein